MPTYEYECSSCGRRFEKFQSITADPLTECILEGCDPPGRVRRLIGTGAAVLFKGSGFYETDYRSKDYESRKKADTTAGTDSAAKSDAGGSKEAAPSKDKASSSESGTSGGATSPDKAG